MLQRLDEADAGLANLHNHDATTDASSILVLLFRKRDADLRNGFGRKRHRTGIVDELLLLGVAKRRIATRVYRQAESAAIGLRLLVRRERAGLFAGIASAANHDERNPERDAERNQNHQRYEEVAGHLAVGITVVRMDIVVATEKSAGCHYCVEGVWIIVVIGILVQERRWSFGVKRMTSDSERM